MTSPKPRPAKARRAAFLKTAKEAGPVDGVLATSSLPKAKCPMCDPHTSFLDGVRCRAHAKPKPKTRVVWIVVPVNEDGSPDLDYGGEWELDEPENLSNYYYDSDGTHTHAVALRAVVELEGE